MTPPRPTELAHTILRGVIHAGDTVVDATCGNGHDTRFLAGLVGNAGLVHAFDIQASAIDAAKRLLESECPDSTVRWHLQSHRTMPQVVPPQSARVVMFNLGYLPGQDHGITTEVDETIAALQASTDVLMPGGLLSVVCYPGHDAGAIEAAEVERWMATLTSDRWRVAKYAMLATLKPAPFLLLAGKPD